MKHRCGRCRRDMLCPKSTKKQAALIGAVFYCPILSCVQYIAILCLSFFLRMIFELYIQNQHLDKELWQRFIRKIIHKTSSAGEVMLEVHFGTDELRFFIHSKKDLSHLSNEFLPFIFKREEATEPIYFKKRKRSWAVIHDNESFIALKERQEYHNRRVLKKIFIKINKYIVFDWCTAEFLFVDHEGTLFVRRKRYNNFPAALFDLDFSKVIKYKKKSVPIYVKLQKAMNLFTKNKEEGFMEVNGFPYLHEPEYFPIKHYDLGRHSLIVGQTGTGKSKFLELFIKQMHTHKLTDEYCVVVIDPHATLFSDFVSIPGSFNVDFLYTSCKLFAQMGEPKVATELTILLFQTLMKDQFNPKMERVLKYTLFVLFACKVMSLDSLKKFLTDIGYRKEVLSNDVLHENIIQFFDTDFIELETKFYELSVMPILVLLDELTFLPMSNFQDSDSLQDLVAENNFLFLSLNKILLGEKATKLIAGLLIQQLFLLSQSKVFTKKIIFIIDEVSVVQNDALSAILSEARKFNLSLFLTQQYLGQVETNLLNSIITNVYNYFIFKISEDDAKILVNNLEFEFTEEQLMAAKDEKGLKEEDLRTRMITTLNPRECLVRVYKDGTFYPVFKSKTMNI